MNRMISFGYGYKDGKLIVVESEAEIVKSIFTDYINGKILKEIADELTIKGIDFFNGKCCWNKNMVLSGLSVIFVSSILSSVNSILWCGRSSFKSNTPPQRAQIPPLLTLQDCASDK